MATYLYVIDRFCDGKHISLTLFSFSEAMQGSGLGGSSTLVVSMLKCYDSLLNIGLDASEIANHAYNIERNICHISGGRQDYYPLPLVGLTISNLQNLLPLLLNLPPSLIVKLETSFILHYTGISRVQLISLTNN